MSDSDGNHKNQQVRAKEEQHQQEQEEQEIAKDNAANIAQNTSKCGREKRKRKRCVELTGYSELMIFPEEHRQRIIRFRTRDQKVVEVKWHLMMQCNLFKKLWENLRIEDDLTLDHLASFECPLKDITEECFLQLLNWMANYDGIPTPAVTHNSVGMRYPFITILAIIHHMTQTENLDKLRNLFTFGDWETQFFKMDFKLLMECYKAAHSLGLTLLYYCCAQEIGHRILHKTSDEVDEMLELGWSEESFRVDAEAYHRQCFGDEWPDDDDEFQTQGASALTLSCFGFFYDLFAEGQQEEE